MGASVCASGSHVWNGNIGTLIAKPMNNPPKMRSCVPCTMPAPAACESSTMSKVCPTPGTSTLK